MFYDKPLKKKRTNLPKVQYFIDGADGNGYIIKAMDESVRYYPHYKKVKDSSGPFAATLDNGKPTIIKEIMGYSERTQKYRVIYTVNSINYIMANEYVIPSPYHWDH